MIQRPYLDWSIRDFSWNIYLNNNYSSITKDESFTTNSYQELFYCLTNEESITLTKVDSSGNIIWNKQDISYNFFNTQSACTSVNISVDLSDNIILAYSYMLEGNNDRISLVKLNKEGEIIWIYNLIQEDYTIAEKNPVIKIDSQNQIYIAYVRIADSSQQPVIIKLDPNGNLLSTMDQFYEHSYTNLSMISSYLPKPSLQLDENNIYLTFNFQSTNETFDIVVLKLDLSGNIVWNHNFNETSIYHDTPKLDIDHSGNIYVSCITYDPNVPSTKIPILFKLDQSGNESWKNTFSNITHLSEIIIPFQHIQVKNEFIYLSLTQNVDENDSSIVLLKLDLNGNIIWTENNSSLNDFNGITDRRMKRGIFQVNDQNDIYGIYSDGYPVYFKFYQSDIIKVDTSNNVAIVLDLSSGSSFVFEDPVFPSLQKEVKIFYSPNVQNLNLTDQISDLGVQVSVLSAPITNKFIFGQVDSSWNTALSVSETQIAFILKVLDENGTIQTNTNLQIIVYLDQNKGDIIQLTVNGQNAGIGTRQTPIGNKYPYQITLTRGDGVYIGSFSNQGGSGGTGGTGGSGGGFSSVGSDPHIKTIFGKKYDLHPSTRKNYCLLQTKEYNILSHFTGYKSGLFYDKVWIETKDHEKIQIDFNKKKIKGKSDSVHVFENPVKLDSIRYENLTFDKRIGSIFSPKPFTKLSIFGKNPLDLWIDFQTRYIHFQFTENIPPPIELKGLIVEKTN